MSRSRKSRKDDEDENSKIPDCIRIRIRCIRIRHSCPSHSFQVLALVRSKHEVEIDIGG